MKKKLLLACVVFGMNATAQTKDITIKGHYPLKMYKYSKEYVEYNNLDWSYFKNQVETQWKDGKWVYSDPEISLYWAPKYFMYNQDTVVLTVAFDENEIYNGELYLEIGNYKVAKIADKIWMLVK